MSFHFNVATEGVRAGHKFLSVLGLKWLSIDIIPPQPQPTLGGGRVNYQFEPLSSEYYTIRITLKIDGKKIVRSYTTYISDSTVKISIKFIKSIVRFIESIKATLKESIVLNKLVHSKVTSVQTLEPEISIKLKDIKIEVKVND